MLDHTQEVTVSVSFQAAQEFIAARVQQLATKIVHAEHVTTTDGQYAVLVAVSQPVKASGLFPLLMQGARHTMFFVRVREANGAVTVVASAGGAETLSQFDFGRNRNLVDYVLEGIEDAGLPRRDRS